MLKLIENYAKLTEFNLKQNWQIANRIFDTSILRPTAREKEPENQAENMIFEEKS